MLRSAIHHRAHDNWCYALDLQTLHIRLQTAAGDVDRVTVRYGDPFEWKDRQWVWQESALRKWGGDGLHDFWETEIALDWKRFRYCFFLSGGGESWLYGETGFMPAGEGAAGDAAAGPAAARQAAAMHKQGFTFPYISGGDRFAAPDWVGRTVWYQIFPERYRIGEGAGDQAPDRGAAGLKAWHEGPVTNQERYGGNLRGITDSLDWIAGLGCNGLYLTPVFRAPSAHKYDTADYYCVDPAFGSNQDLKDLVAAAHRRGIKVILDAVFNHSGTRFAPWLDVLAHGRDSRYADWFCIRGWEPLDFESFAFWKGMPKLNTANPAVRDYLLEVARFWIRECDIDGWRLDVANEVDHGFWRAFRQAVKAIKPDAYIVGEVWHDSLQWLRGDQFDAVMNYRYGNAISDFVTGEGRHADARAWCEAMDGIDMSYPLPVIRAAFNVLDSHDTDRLITRSGGDRVRSRLAWFLQFMQKGSPCVYYGSEIGLEGGMDPDNRRLMIWDGARHDGAQLEFFRWLIACRHRLAGLLNEGQRRWVLSGSAGQLGGCRIDARPGRPADGPGTASAAAAAPSAVVWLFNRAATPADPAQWRALTDRACGGGEWRVLRDEPGPWGWKLLEMA